ncbi:MAG: phage holin family protein [Alphaproteobacteria bacterium]
MPQTIGEDRSFRALFGDLAHGVSALARQEAALARAEVGEKMTRAGSGVVFMAVGAVILLGGWLVLLAALVAGVHVALAGVEGAAWVTPEGAAWMAPLIVGGVTAVIGLALLWWGRDSLRVSSLTPQRTLHTLRRAGTPGSR